MRLRFPRFLAVGLAATAAITMTGVPPGTAATGDRVVTRTAPAADTAILLNGDRVFTVSPGTYGMIPAGSGFGAAVTEINVGRHVYAVPGTAMPYLGRGLDPSLFDIARLPRTGRLPVTITYRGAVPLIPGISVTGAKDGIATGYLTASSARDFGAALTRQLSRDHLTGGYGSDGMFANGTTIALAGARRPVHLPRPAFPMHTLTVHGTTLNGQPDTGDVVTVLNMDSLDYFGNDAAASTNVLFNGTTRFSVPGGDYLAFVTYTDYNSSNHPVAQRLVMDPAFTVAGDTTIKVTEKSATSAVAVTIPRPAALQYLYWALQMTDKNGGYASIGTFYTSKLPYYVSPVRRHSPAGSMHVVVAARYTSGSAATAPYSYDLSFTNPANVISKQSYVATTGNLAAVTARYYSDSSATSSLAHWPLYSFNANEQYLALLLPQASRLAETEYLSAGTPPVYWRGVFVQNLIAGGGQTDSTRSYRPGAHTSEDWNAYPLHTPLNTSVLGSRDLYPTALSVTRAADTLSFDLVPFGDDTPGHYGMGFATHPDGPPGQGITGSYVLDENGKQIAAGNADSWGRTFVARFLANIHVSPGPATFRLALDANRTVSPFVLSDKTSTMWTWRSAHESGNVLPAGWTCPNHTQHCAAQPLMTLDYNVAKLGLDGVAPAGGQTVRIDVSHQQLAASSPTAGLTASFSADEGATWHPATVKGSGSTWYASFNAPPGSKVSLRVAAADKAGSAITESVLGAYQTATAAGYGAPRCAATKTGQFGCGLRYAPAAGSRTTASGHPEWGARDIERAYRLPVSRGGSTVAVVEVLDTPKLETYLNTYRKRYGLAPCTTADGCLRKVNEYGQASPLPQNGTGSGWDLEATVDAEMVSAACPMCRILVVEAKAPTFSDVATAEDTAARLGAAVIDNSFGARENGVTQKYAAAFDHPGHTIVAPAGDTGFSAAQFPANLASVTAVGGTELARAHNARGYSETVYNVPLSATNCPCGAGGSACSAYVAKPAWQHDGHCPGRTIADVSAVADDVLIYNADWSGWLTVGTTSLSTPIIAGTYGLAGNAARIAPGQEYAHPSAFFDITRGNNDWVNQTHGAACGYDYLCVARPGYDAPTGLGTPDGIGGF